MIAIQVCLGMVLFTFVKSYISMGLDRKTLYKRAFEDGLLMGKHASHRVQLEYDRDGNLQGRVIYVPFEQNQNCWEEK